MKRFPKVFLHYFIAIALFAVIRFFLPAGNGLTEVGVNTVAAFLSIAYLWIFVAVDWTSMLMLGVFTVCGTMTMNQLVAAAYNWVIPLTILATAMNLGLQYNGVLQRMVRWFITRKIIIGRPWVFITFLFLAGYLACVLTSVIEASVLMIPICESICKEMGYEREEKFPKMVYMGTMWAILLGFGATPMGHTIPLQYIALMQSLCGVEITFFQYMSVGIPTSLLLLFASILIFKIILRSDTAKFSNYDVSTNVATTKMTRQEKICIATLATVVFLYMAPNILTPILPEVAAYLGSLGLVVPALIGTVALIVIHVDGKPVLDFQRALRDMPWSTVLLITGTNVAAGVLSAESTGITTWLGNVFTPLVSGNGSQSWVLVVIIASIWTLIMTNVMSCLVTANIVTLVMAPLALSMGFVNPIALTFCVCMLSNLGVLTPPASLPAAYFLGSGWVSLKDGMKYGLILCLVGLLSAIVVFYPIASLILPA